MHPDGADRRNHPEPQATQAFQSENAEHAAPAQPAVIGPLPSGPAAAYQREDEHDAGGAS